MPDENMKIDVTLDLLVEMWKDQQDFNQTIFPEAINFQEKSRQTKEFILHMISELDELLRCTEWKLHRKTNVQPNHDHVREEVVDILKYLMSICLVWNIDPALLIQDYWRKSMVVRQRYSEEFCKDLDGEVALIDIDGVLADYPRGLANWVIKNHPSLTDEINNCLDNNLWIDAKSLGIDDQVWQEIKHEFRTSRGKLGIPPTPNAKEFLEACKDADLTVVLLTSRPIDQYPNLYADTLEWLQNNGLKFDYLWWAVDKKEAILSKNIRTKIKFAVDDDLKYVMPYHRMGIPCYWMDWMNPKNRDAEIPEGVMRICELGDILNVIKVKELE